MYKKYLFAISAILIFSPVVAAAQPVDIKIIVNATGGAATSTFDYQVTSGSSVYPSNARFTINTQNNFGQYQIPDWNSPLKEFSINQFLQPGWRPVSIECINTEPAGTFTPTIDPIPQRGGVFVTIPEGDNHITCTFNNQYSESWLRHSYESDIKIIVKTIGGDGTFNYYLASSFWDKTPDRRFDIATVNGQGEYYLEEWNPIADNFMLYEYTDWENWKPAGVVCTNTEAEGQFIYNVDPNPITKSIYVQVPKGYNRITCTFTIINKNAKTPVLFVPGILGTEIYNGNEKIWPDVLRMIFDGTDSFMDTLSFTGELASLSQINKKAVIRKELNFFDYTQGLINEFVGKGYKEGKDFFTFPYDWRYGVSGKYQDGKTNSDLLREKIDELVKNSPTGKVDVIAHSMGGLIVKKYVKETTDPMIGKLVFVGVPDLGAPRAARILLEGDNLDVFGLSQDEFKKIGQNMPGAYDLLPGAAYYLARSSYLATLTSTGGQGMGFRYLNYYETQNYLNSNLNNTALNNSRNLHDNELDNYDITAKVPNSYDIVGCKSWTTGITMASTKRLGMSIPGGNITGDDTVPFESADNIPVAPENKFYFAKAKHGQMPSYDGIRQKIFSIIAGVDYPEYKGMVTHDQLVADHKLCELEGDRITVKSPLDIFVTETDNGQGLRLGLDENRNIINEIPGASFEIVDGHKYLYLPTGDGEVYDIDLKGAGSGTFTLIKQEIKGEVVGNTQVFNDIPVTTAFIGSLDLAGTAPKIIVAGGNEIVPTATIEDGAALDILEPQTAVLINGAAPQTNYAAANISFFAQDSAQEGAAAAGVFSVSYSLDGAATTTIAGAAAAISVNAEGPHTLVFFAGDKLGNKEIPQTISFTVTKPVDTGTLTIIKKSGTANGTFKFKVTGPTALAPVIATVNGTGTTGALKLNVGQYTLSEILPTGWTLNGLSCSVSCSGSCSSSMSQKNFVQSFKMAKGMKVTCTFTNKKK